MQKAQAFGNAVLEMKSINIHRQANQICFEDQSGQ